VSGFLLLCSLALYWLLLLLLLLLLLNCYCCRPCLSPVLSVPLSLCPLFVSVLQPLQRPSSASFVRSTISAALAVKYHDETTSQQTFPTLSLLASCRCACSRLLFSCFCYSFCWFLLPLLISTLSLSWPGSRARLSLSLRQARIQQRVSVSVSVSMSVSLPGAGPLVHCQQSAISNLNILRPASREPQAKSRNESAAATILYPSSEISLSVHDQSIYLTHMSSLLRSSSSSSSSRRLFCRDPRSRDLTPARSMPSASSSIPSLPFFYLRAISDPIPHPPSLSLFSLAPPPPPLFEFPPLRTPRRPDAQTLRRSFLARRLSPINRLPFISQPF
jgi:hypothetical protein